MTAELQVGAVVRVKPMMAIGQITRVSSGCLKRWPYLVLVPGVGERSFAAEELEPLPPLTVLTLPPYGAPFP